MRINRIHLTSFGHFTGQTVDLDHPSGGLRVVVGPNEAGKSTLLRALRVGLFGPSGRFTAGQPTSSLRLTLEVEAGGVSGSISRTGGGAPTSDDVPDLDDATLAAMVGADEALFTQLFTINHDELRRFGEPLLQSDGGIGELVFGAALGGQRVKQVGDRLTAELDELFKARGRTAALNRAVDAVTEADAELNSVLITADSWADTKATIDDLTTRISEVDDHLERLRAETSKLERITTVRPQLVRRGTLVSSEESIRAAGPIPPESGWSRLAEVIQQLAESSSAAAELDGRIEALRGQRDAVPTDRRAVEAGADIVALSEQVAVYRTAASDIARLTPVVDGAQTLTNADALRSALADTAPLSDIAGQIPQRSADLAGLEAEAIATSRRLGLDAGDLDALLQLAVPEVASIETARDRSAELATMEKSAAKVLKAAKAAVKAAGKAVRDVEQGGEVATPDDVAAARETRDDAVKRVRKRLLKGPKPGEPANDELVTTLEVSIGEVDRAADSVINDTDRAAQLLAARAEVARASSSQEDAEHEVARLKVERGSFEETWTASWTAAGISPGGPDEMRSWRTSWVELCDLITELRSGQAAMAEDRHRVATATERLRAVLDAAGTPTPVDAELPGLVEIAQRLIDEHDAIESDRSTLAAAAAQIEALDTAIDPLLPLLGESSTARGDRAISALEALRQEQQRHDDEVRRLDGEVLELEEQAADHRAAAEDADRALRELAEQFQIPTDGLPAASERSFELADVQTALRELDDDLISSTGLKIDRLLDEAAEAGGPDEVAARIERIKLTVQSQSEERDQLVEERRTRQIEFDRATGGSDAAIAQQDVEEALATLGEVTERYMRTALAKAVLDRVVDSVGGSGHGDLIEQAGRLFEHLTGGAFTSIGMEQHGTRTIATALRSTSSGGVPVFVPSLSDGTQDQLWLSLRLAGVFEHVEQVGAVPVVVDDLLVNFDDDRAALALDLLAELAQHTQVIVITHHPHLVEIARARIGDDLLRVSELGPRPQNAPVMAQVVAADEEVSPRPLPELTAPAQRATPTSADNADATALLAAIRSGRGKKNDLIARSGIPESAWTSTIRQLTDDGLVVRDGHFYELVPEPGAGDDTSEDVE